jgi:ATP-binding protein involved in chromosome partitioning
VTPAAPGTALTSVRDPLELEEIESARRRVAERLAPVSRVIAVMSGKGGVGKSAVAVNLALALAQRGLAVGLLDADLHGPSVAKMLGLRGQPLRLVAGETLRPVAGPRGLRVQSMDFFLQGNQPLDWEGEQGEAAALRSAMEQAAMADLLACTDWGTLDTLIVDLAPGSDRLPAFGQFVRSALAALAITLPTEVAMLAVERSLRRAYAARIPLIGLVENFASVVCPSCGAEGPLYREASVERLARDLGSEVVARIPFDAKLAQAADQGRAFLEGEGARSAAGKAFLSLADRVQGFEIPGPEGESW